MAIGQRKATCGRGQTCSRPGPISRSLVLAAIMFGWGADEPSLPHDPVAPAELGDRTLVTVDRTLVVICIITTQALVGRAHPSWLPSASDGFVRIPRWERSTAPWLLTGRKKIIGSFRTLRRGANPAP